MALPRRPIPSMDDLSWLLLPAVALVAYSLLALYVDDPVRASTVDRFILHNTDETFRFHHLRHALANPAHLLSSYARPVYTLVGALFHALLPGEMLSLRLMNALLSAATLWLVLLLARQAGLSSRQAVLALLITATSPTYLLHSVSVQATPMCALALLFSLYLLQRGRLTASTLLAGLLPLIRPEGTVSLVLWAWFILRARGRRGLPLLALLLGPMAAFVLLNRLALGPGVLDRVQYHAVLLSLGMFGENPFANLRLDLAVLARPLANYLSSLGPPVVVLALAGLVLRPGNKEENQRPRVLLLVTGLYFAFYALFTLPIGFGLEKMSAWGHLEYAAAPLTPLIALLAAAPLALADRWPASTRVAMLGVAVMAALLTNLHTLQTRRGDFRFHWRPAVSEAQHQEMSEAGAWLEEQARSGGIKTIYLLGEDGASGLTNLFLPHLPEAVGYRLLLAGKGGPLRALDMSTFTFGAPRHAGALLLSSTPAPLQLTPRLTARPLKSFPVASLHFHALTAAREAKP